MSFAAHRHVPLPTGLFTSFREELVALRDRELGRELGSCPGCGKFVRSQQEFIRRDGFVMHVRCRSVRTAPPPTLQ